MTVLHSKMDENTQDVDEIDRLPSKDRASNWDVIGFSISILTHFVDVGLDCNLAYRYYSWGQHGYFWSTIGIILFPAIVNTAFSIRMYMEDGNTKTTLTKRVTKRKILCALVLLFQLAPVLRYFDALRYALKSKHAAKHNDIDNQRKYFELMVKEDSDVALLRVLECFLEAAPQQILQITIILVNHGDGIDILTFIHQLLSIASSFGAMAWSMAAYQRLIRFSLKTKNNISWAGTFMQFMWHFLVTVSRILSISVIASIYLEHTIFVLIVHWFVMTTWLYITTNSNFCSTRKAYEMLFFSIFGMVYTFTHVSLSDGKTKFKYLFFYTILFVENTVANAIWILTADDELRKQIYFLPIVYLNVIPFVAGIAFMIAYYKVFHPSTGIVYFSTHACAPATANQC